MLECVFLARASPRKPRPRAPRTTSAPPLGKDAMFITGSPCFGCPEGKRSAPERSTARRRRASRWASRSRRHLRRRSLGPERRESLRVRQLVTRGFRSRRSRVYGVGGGEGGGGGADASPLEAPSNAIGAKRWGNGGALPAYTHQGLSEAVSAAVHPPWCEP